MTNRKHHFHQFMIKLVKNFRILFVKILKNIIHSIKTIIHSIKSIIKINHRKMSDSDQPSQLDTNVSNPIISKFKGRIEQEQSNIRNEMLERSKKNMDLVTKQREFLKSIKKENKDKYSSIQLTGSLDEPILETNQSIDKNQNMNDQLNRNLKRTEQKMVEKSKDQILINMDDNLKNPVKIITSSKSILPIKSNERPIDLSKSKSMNSRKLLQSIINRNLLTKINLPNLKLSYSIEDLNDLNEENKRFKMDRDDRNETNMLDKNNSKEDLMDDSSKDGSNDSSINNSRESLNSRSNNGSHNRSKRTGKRRNKRAKDDGSNENEKENQDDNLTCSSEPTEVISEREKNRSIGYPGLAFGCSIFSSNTMMRFRLISNELHNIQNVQLKRVINQWCLIVVF